MFVSQREPARLVDSDSTDEFTQRLLRSAGVDQPPMRAVDRAMVHVTSLLAEEMDARSPARHPGEQEGVRITGVLPRSRRRSSRIDPLRVTRAAGVGLLLGTSLAAAVVGVTQRTTQETHPVVIEPASSAPKGQQSTQGTARRGIPTADQALDAPTPSTTSLSQARETKPTRVSTNDLGQELALLDTAKVALSRANPGHALRALDDASKLSQRALVPEATVLRVRALVALRRTSEARQLVEHFVAQSPRSPVNPVLRDLVAPLEKK